MRRVCCSLDSAQNSNETREQKGIRSSYQALRKYIRNPDILKVDTDEYKKFFESNDYLNLPKDNVAALITNHRIQILLKTALSIGILIAFLG